MRHGTAHSRKATVTIMIVLFGLTAMGATARADDAAAKMYQGKCVACHAADGGGSAVGQKLGAHDFRTADVQKMSDAELTDIIAKGKNKMPAYEKTLKADEIKGLVAYLRTLKK
jgi:mono/diheme cytochrome c family protein